MLEHLKNLHLHEFGDVDLHGYQSCKICGKSHFVGKAECRHTWRVINTFTYDKRWFRDERTIYVQECRVCGILNKFEV